jgi:hypothetical protein
MPFAIAAVTPTLAAQRTVTVSPSGPVRTITEAVRKASAGDRIIVKAGIYREPTIVVDSRLQPAGSR